MITIIPADERHGEDLGWLRTRWHFSFDHHRDPANISWGPLRVFNDDEIQPATGFELHPHHNMEIITVMVDGEMEHRDTMGHVERLGAGEVQVMSAGAGLKHSEKNESPDQLARLLQLWILPRTRGTDPWWAKRSFPAERRRGRLLPVVSPDGEGETLSIDQDATIYLSSLAPGDEVEHVAEPGRHTYLYIISGEAAVNGRRLKAGDQARMENETNLRIGTDADAELILLDLP